ncbi:AAA family ATPase [Aquella oligotrophica]|uniref:ATPase AAA-type core domain-containing protein n=1 Tax=Aquella oligotrophica TaxID=2067065 RepID=A0A2I7N4Z2_9NEIS|nr:AAA family ATPase [Aquella oligotrophica]AUR51534.1 hypothetical protein CUN60_04265 [Aquella oligotrophica]
MRIKKIQLKQFKRFDDLTLDLGNEPRKIIALVGPNGCGKSSIFDAFEAKLKNFRNYGDEGNTFYSKALFYEDQQHISQSYSHNNSIIIEPSLITRKSFYIRTSYRFTSKLNVTQIKALPDMLSDRSEPISTIALDTRLESNYKRLIGNAQEQFEEGSQTYNQVKEALIGKINQILRSVLDIEISSLGNILKQKGQLYFKKGNTKDFPYSNLSSGEKEVVDIIIDLIIKVEKYTETVFCIDEPELHLNTSIQRKLLIEIEKLIPENCQLWIATHSIGFLRALQEELKDKSQVIDFSADDYFTGTKIINPIKPSRQNWQRIFNTALEDLTGLISPRKIIYCEGRDSPGRGGVERGMDAQVFNTVFAEKYHDVQFVSSGGNTELDQRSDIALAILTKVFSDIEILVLKDRDMASGRDTDEQARQLYLNNNPSNHRVLKRWEIENYLFDKEVLQKYCLSNELNFNEEKYDSEITDIINQHVKDNLSLIKNICGITTNVTPDIFKINLSKIITSDMNVYQELENCIFNRQ